MKHCFCYQMVDESWYLLTWTILRDPLLVAVSLLRNSKFSCFTLMLFLLLFIPILIFGVLLCAPLLLFLFALYYLLYVDVVNVQYCKTKRMEIIVKKCGKLREKYWPTFWACSGHLQTALSIFRPIPFLPLKR